MSWQLGAFSILAVALAAGFAWYEHTRPDARIVALVATLAALAALGRIAFAALPNVKPTTDIVLIAGLALGGAPGFVVGAVAGLTSNFFFGQGPWTPWQMACWGAVGVLGALLARSAGGRVGRWPLAITCALAGYGFAAVQDLGDWVNFSDHSLSQLGVYVGRGTAFDLIHAGGCFVFALAFGPSLTHSLRRFSARLKVTWRTFDGAVVPTLALVCVAAGAGLVTAAPARAAATPSGYLLAAQNRDGGFGGAAGAVSSELEAGWAALGLASAGHNPLDVSVGGPSLLAYVSAGGDSFSDTGAVERTILVARSAGLSAQAFAGRDLLARLHRAIGRDGAVSDQVNLTAFAVLALRAAGLTPSARTLAWLTRQQNSDGGFSFATAGGGSDVDDTAAALQALRRRPGTAARAVAFIRGDQNGDGGFPAQVGGFSNAQSTAWAVQGLLAAGVEPASLHRAGAPSPLRYLSSLIAADGHVRYARGSDETPVWVTAEALMALERRTLPIAPVARVATTPPRVTAAGSAPSRRAAAAAGRRSGHGGPVAHIAAPRHRGGALRIAPPRETLSGLAADAGVAAALVFAPLGLS